MSKPQGLNFRARITRVTQHQLNALPAVYRISFRVGTGDILRLRCSRSMWLRGEKLAREKKLVRVTTDEQLLVSGLVALKVSK